MNAKGLLNSYKCTSTLFGKWDREDLSHWETVGVEYPSMNRIG